MVYVALSALLVFSCTAVADAIWAIYIKAAAGHQVLRASSASAALILIGSVSLLEYVNNRWLVIPAAAGAFVGSYASLRAYGDSKE